MLIVGLGNPGSTYAHTRHNIGFMVINELVRRTSATTISKASFEGELFKHKDFYFLKPMTFMNLSGRSILAVKNFYKIDKVVVIHDDLDLPLEHFDLNLLVDMAVTMDLNQQMKRYQKSMQE
jgi:PTH1 family peptidyl-tRNA hydrolase